MSEPVTIKVKIGDSNREFRIGDLLNAIDQVVCYFESESRHGTDELADAIRLYAKSMEG